MIVRANPHITEKPLGENRPIFAGTLEQIKEDTEACRRIGAHDVIRDDGEVIAQILHPLGPGAYAGDVGADLAV